MPSPTSSAPIRHPADHRVVSGLGRLVTRDHAVDRLVERMPMTASWDRHVAQRRLAGAIHAGHAFGASNGTDLLIRFDLRVGSGSGSGATDMATLVAVLRPIVGGHAVITVLTPEQAAANQETAFRRLDLGRGPVSTGLRSALDAIAAERRTAPRAAPCPVAAPVPVADIPPVVPASGAWPKPGIVDTAAPATLAVASRMLGVLDLRVSKDIRKVWRGWHGAANVPNDNTALDAAIIERVRSGHPVALCDHGLHVAVSGAFGLAQFVILPGERRIGGRISHVRLP